MNLCARLSAFAALGLAACLLSACDKPTVVNLPPPVAQPGPAGPAGPMGAPGAAGETGATGSTGASGSAGQPGPDAAPSTVIVLQPPAASAPSK